MAMLFTGRTLDEMRGEEYDVAREQVLSLLAGRVGSSLGRGIERGHRPQRSAHRAQPDRQRGRSQRPPHRGPGDDRPSWSWSTPPTSPTAAIRSGSREYDVTRRFQTQRHPAERQQLPDGLPPRRPLRRHARAAPPAAAAPDGGASRHHGRQPLPDDRDARAASASTRASRCDLLRRPRRHPEARRTAAGARLPAVAGAARGARSTETSVRLHVAVTAGPAVDLRILGGRRARRRARGGPRSSGIAACSTRNGSTTASRRCAPG